MYKVKHWSIGLGVAATLVLALAFVPSAFAAPSGWFDNTRSYTEDTGIVCGSGAGSFDIGGQHRSRLAAWRVLAGSGVCYRRLPLLSRLRLLTFFTLLLSLNCASRSKGSKGRLGPCSRMIVRRGIQSALSQWIKWPITT